MHTGPTCIRAQPAYRHDMHTSTTCIQARHAYGAWPALKAQSKPNKPWPSSNYQPHLSPTPSCHGQTGGELQRAQMSCTPQKHSATSPALPPVQLWSTRSEPEADRPEMSIYKQANIESCCGADQLPEWSCNGTVHHALITAQRHERSVETLA